jgi:hypothetical protein
MGVMSAIENAAGLIREGTKQEEHGSDEVWLAEGIVGQGAAQKNY